jgi:hypothetical protein
MVTREYKWMGVTLTSMGTQVGGANTINFSPIEVDGVEADIRTTATYTTPDVAVAELDHFMASQGWAPA